MRIGIQADYILHLFRVQLVPVNKLPPCAEPFFIPEDAEGSPECLYFRYGGAFCREGVYV